jgi:hypothetical protein
MQRGAPAKFDGSFDQFSRRIVPQELCDYGAVASLGRFV